MRDEIGGPLDASARWKTGKSPQGVMPARHRLFHSPLRLRAGDTLVVWRLDRLGRSMQHLVSIITELKARGIGFRSLRDGAIDTTTASGELVFNIFAALAQFERELIRERTRAGLAAARARGRTGGRKPVSSLNPKVKMAQRMNQAAA